MGTFCQIFVFIFMKTLSKIEGKILDQFQKNLAVVDVFSILFDFIYVEYQIYLYLYFQKKVGQVKSKEVEDEMKDAENLENSFNSVGFIGQDISAILESTTEEIENSIVQENPTKEDLENGIKPMEPNTPEVSENPETTMEDIENSIVDQENSAKEDLENSNVEENSIKPKVGY